MVSYTVLITREDYAMDVPALVLHGNNTYVPLLLGRNGFFENFSYNI